MTFLAEIIRGTSFLGDDCLDFFFFPLRFLIAFCKLRPPLGVPEDELCI